MPHPHSAPALLLCALLLAPLGALLPRGVLRAVTPPRLPGYQLTFDDEFNSPADAPVDPAKWTFDTGGGGFGNHELESYTTRTANARQSGGNLVLTALKERYTGSDGIARDFTSARLKTQGRFSQKYGRFEARIRLPLGKGIWPAFWMLGDNISTVGWPHCGEIDILENIGDPTRIYSTLHGPGNYAPQSIYTFPPAQGVDSAFHIYALEWEPDEVRYYLDGKLYGSALRTAAPAGSWVFDQPFFILLNLAVGGDWPGSPDASTIFPQVMLIDYVRVYAKDRSPAP